jgi:hypothetical protein
MPSQARSARRWQRLVEPDRSPRMKNRRTFLMTVTAAVVALGVVVVPALADELLGVLTKVDVETKKLTVVQAETDKEVEITVNDDTEQVTRKGDIVKVDLEKLSKGVEKAKEKGRKGLSVKVTHEKNVASKIQVTAKKKAEN